MGGRAENDPEEKHSALNYSCLGDKEEALSLLHVTDFLIFQLKSLTVQKEKKEKHNNLILK